MDGDKTPQISSPKLNMISSTTSKTSTTIKPDDGADGLVLRRSRQRKPDKEQQIDYDELPTDCAVVADEDAPVMFAAAAAVKYDPTKHPNPFRYWPEYSLCDYLIMALAVPLLPLKLLGIALCFLTSLLISPLVLVGVDRRNPPKLPFTGLRANIGGSLVYFIIRCLFFFIGITWIQFKRLERAGADETEWAAYDESQAPVIVAVPHTSYLDGVIVAALRCSPVARISSRKNPFTGFPMDAIQTIWVDRHSTANRQQAADLVRQRQQQPGWPPTVIFPEGTTTAGNVLYFFKNGAFRSGRPVLPVTIRYNVATSANPCMAFAWDGPAVWKTAIQILLQPFIVVTLTLLPLYIPSEPESEEPNLYAGNVQKMFSKFLNMPYSKITLEDAEKFAAKVGSAHANKGRMLKNLTDEGENQGGEENKMQVDAEKIRQATAHA